MAAQRESVCLREVGLRDGLQLTKTILSTERKLEWCRLAAAAGISEIEVTSFVPAKFLPQFSDAEDVVRGALAIKGLLASALVLNFKGAQRGLATGIPKLTYVISASEAHSLANARRTTDQSIEEFARIIELRDAQTTRTTLGVGIATAFGCSISGRVPEDRVVEIAARVIEMGADELTIADTVGYANPPQVKRIFKKIAQVANGKPACAHFHDTRGLGLANVSAALDVGIRSFDASLGGLGGCPYAPGATGNINLEDTAFLLEASGFSTGINIEALLQLRALVETWLPNEGLGGAVARAGVPQFLLSEREFA